MTKKQKNIIKYIILFFIAAVIIALLITKLMPSAPQPNYITAPVIVADIEEAVMVTGKVKAINSVNVGAQVSGEVKHLYVKLGDTVKKGDVIAQIDKVTQTNKLSNAQVTLTQNNANLQTAKANLQTRIANLETAKAALNSKIATMQKSEAQFTRLKSLMDINAISKQDYENAEVSLKSAQADVISAKANIKSAEAEIVNAQANITNQEANLQKSQTDLDTATKNLNYTTIVSPINGTIVSVTTKQGSTVNSMQSAPTIVTVADLSQVKINAKISEADVIKVKQGMPVQFNMIGTPNEKLQATLTSLAPAPESKSGSAVYYTGYVEVPNPDNKFRIDMTAQLQIIIQQKKNVLTIPSAAINTSGTQNTVRVLKADDSVEDRVVTVGINNRVNAEIISGLEEGEKIVLSDDSQVDINQNLFE